MNWITTYRTLLGAVCLSIATLASSIAQTISTPTVSPTNPCPGSPISATVSTTGSFSAGNSFTLQLSDEFGTFGSPTAVASVTASPTSATSIVLTGTLGTSLNYGTAYRFRVRSSAPVVTGGQSGAAITIGTPLPGLAQTASFCQNTGNQSISATGTAVEWYTSFNAAAPAVASGNTYSVPTTVSGTVTYYATQTVNGCKSAKAAINVSVYAPPASQPTVANTSPAYCPTPSPTALSASTNGTGTSIRWYSPPSSTTSGGTTLAAPTATGTYAYTVSQLSAQGCESARQFVNVTVYTAPTTVPTIASTSPTYCANNAPANLLASTNGAGSSILWTTPANTTINSLTIAAPTASGTYQVQQLSANGCSGPQQVVNVTVNPVPLAPTFASNTPTYCSSAAPATLSANTVGTGVTLKWYLPANAGGGTLVQATIPAPMAAGTYSYSVSQVSTAGCEGPQATLTVTINASPTTVPTVASTSPTYCANNAPANLAAAINGAGASIRWTAPNGSVTNALTIPAPTASGIYQVQQISANGCPGPQQAVTVTVNPVPVAPTLTNSNLVYCTSAVPATLSANTVGSGTSLKWYTSAGVLVQPTIPAPTAAGTYSYSVSQVSTAGCEGPQVVLTVTVNTSPTTIPTIADLTPTYCANSAPANLAAAINGAGASIRWTAPNGSVTNALTIPAPTASGIYQVQQISANGCPGPQQAVTVTVNPVPLAPTLSSATLSYCSNAVPANLSAGTVGSGNTLKWLSASGALVQPTIPAPTSAGTYSYSISQVSGAGCEGPQVVLTVTVNAAPTTAPTITNTSPTYCANALPANLAAAVNGAGLSIRWTAPNGTVTNSLTIAAPTTSGTYQVQQVSASGCVGPQQAVVVTVNATPALPGVSNVTFCQSRTAQPLAATGASLTWYDAANNVLPGAPTPSVSTTGSTNYFVTQTSSASCVSAKATLNVTVNAVPAKPAPTTPRPYCAGETADVLVANGTALLWYGTADTGGTGSPQAPRPSATTTDVGTTNYYVTQTVASCESDRQAIAVTVKRKPGLPTAVTNLEFCQNYTAVLPTATAESGASLTWVSPNGNLSPTAPVTPNNSVQIYSYSVFQTLDGCASDRAPFTVRVKPTPTAPGITNFQLCQFGPTRALQVDGVQVSYYDATNTKLTSAPTLPVDQPQTLSYKVTQTLDGCESPKKDYVVIVYPKPGAPITQAVQYCLDQQDQPKQNVQPISAQVSGNNQNLRWFFVDGAEFPAAPTPVTSSTSVFDFGVTQTVNNCQSDRATLRVSVLSTPTPVLSTSLVAYCRNDVAKPFEATGENLTWIDPNGIVTNTTPTPPTINAVPGATYQVYAKGSANGCYSARAKVKLVVNTSPTLAILGGSTINYGQATTLQLRFTSTPPYGYTLSDGTSGSAVDSLVTVSVKPLKTTTYQVANVTNNCGSGLPGNPATAIVTVNIPTITTAALSVTNGLCVGNTFTVDYTTTGSFNTGNLFKVQIADTTSKNFVDVSPASSNKPLTASLPMNLKGGPYFVRVTATNPGAEVAGANSPTVLTVRALPTATLLGTQNVYETYPANLTIVLAGDAPWAITYSQDGGNPISFNTGANPHLLNVQPVKTTTYTLGTVTNACGTGVVSGTAVVTVLPLLAVEEPLSGAVDVYPTPTQATLTVAINTKLTAENPATLTLTDMVGRPVLTQRVTDTRTQLDLSQQPAGLYLLNVSVGDKRVVRKVMKQ